MARTPRPGEDEASELRADAAFRTLTVGDTLETNITGAGTDCIIRRNCDNLIVTTGCISG